MKRAVLVVILIGIAARVLLAWAIGLGVDESYEVVVSRALSLSYLDHPPLSFWMAGIMSRITGGGGHEWGRVLLRLPFVLTFALSTWLMYRLTSRLYGERAGLFAAVLLNVAPVFSLAGGWILPDVPLDCALLGATLALTHVLLGPVRSGTLGPWALAGACTGVALLSKYHAIFLVVGVLAFMLTRREAGARGWLARPEPYVAAAIALIMFSPVLIWNAQHDFASFRFQLSRAVPTHGNRVTALLQNVGGQAGYLLPWLWLPLVYQLVQGLRAGPGGGDASRWLLCCLSVGPIATFTLVSLGGNAGLPHWPAPGYLTLFPLVGAALAAREQRGPHEGRRVRSWIVAATATFVVLVLVAASQIMTGWMTTLAPAAFRRGDPSLEALDWAELRPQLEARGWLGDPQLIVAATHWMDAAKIGYALGGGPEVPIICLGDDPRHFRYLSPVTISGRPALLLVRVERAGSGPNIPAEYAPLFSSLEYGGAVSIHRARRVAIVLAAYRGVAK